MKNFFRDLGTTKANIPNYGYEKMTADKSEVSRAQVLLNVAPMMIGRDTRRRAIQLAGITDSITNFVCLENGLSGNRAEALTFVEVLLNARKRS